jgi:Fe-S cluster biosynthesis and repair protein YggX
LTERLVRCAKLGRELPGLDKPPFAGALGERILEGISREAFHMWEERMPELLRERQWSMGNPADRKALMREMERFLFEEPVAPEAPELPDDAPVPEGMVRCAKIGKVLPRMKKPPFPGALGDRVFEQISEEGWKLWEAQATIVMNHYGLSMADPDARKFLMKQLEEFFFGEGAQLPADWVPPQAGGGKGGGKGAPAPRRK